MKASRMEQNYWNFHRWHLKLIFLNENCHILNSYFIKYVLEGPVVNKLSALAQAMPWHQTGTKPLSVPILIQFHQPRLVIRTFHRQGRCSWGGHLYNEHSEEKYSCSYRLNSTTDILIRFCVDKLYECILILMGLGERLWLLFDN